MEAIGHLYGKILLSENQGASETRLSVTLKKANLKGSLFWLLHAGGERGIILNAKFFFLAKRKSYIKTNYSEILWTSPRIIVEIKSGPTTCWRKEKN